MTNSFPEGGVPSTGELSRQLRDVLLRVTEVTGRVETQFLRKDNFDLVQKLLENEDASNRRYIENVEKKFPEIDKKFSEIEKNVVSSDKYIALERRVSELEDSNKWLMRLVVAFVILGVLGAVISFSGIPIG